MVEPKKKEEPKTTLPYKFSEHLDLKKQLKIPLQQNTHKKNGHPFYYNQTPIFEK